MNWRKIALKDSRTLFLLPTPGDPILIPCRRKPCQPEPHLEVVTLNSLELSAYGGGEYTDITFNDSSVVAVLNPQASVTLDPEWVKQALAAGWKPPKGWRL